jgi:hypothetical protein
MVSTCILTALNTRVNGEMISSMARVMRHGLIVASSTDTMSTQRKKARASTFGQMVTNTLEIGKTMPYQVTVSMSGTMAEFT